MEQDDRDRLDDEPCIHDRPRDAECEECGDIPPEWKPTRYCAKECYLGEGHVLGCAL